MFQSICRRRVCHVVTILLSGIILSLKCVARCICNDLAIVFLFCLVYLFSVWPTMKTFSNYATSYIFSLRTLKCIFAT